MTFPQTRHSLIQRLAGGGTEQDWHEFLGDYWEAVCRFAQRGGTLTREDAEDMAAQTFEALLQNQLLARWAQQPAAKLRTLLCAVTRNVLANRARVQQGRARLLREHGELLEDRPAFPVVTSLDAPAEQVDAFYASWAEEVLQRAIELLLDEYHRDGKGDYFRVLYGRLCERMTLAEVADSLGLAYTQAENLFRHARRRLGQRLEQLVREHVERYCSGEDVEAEFVAEWGQLGQYLMRSGGLEEAVRGAYEGTQMAGRKKPPAHLFRPRPMDAPPG